MFPSSFYLDLLDQHSGEIQRPRENSESSKTAGLRGPHACPQRSQEKRRASLAPAAPQPGCVRRRRPSYSPTTAAWEMLARTTPLSPSTHRAGRRSLRVLFLSYEVLRFALAQRWPKHQEATAETFCSQPHCLSPFSTLNLVPYKISNKQRVIWMACKEKCTMPIKRKIF